MNKESRLERDFQAKLIKDIKSTFKGSIVKKLDTDIQGFPDILILYQNKWAALECKRAANSPRQPNQEYYVKLLNDMSFSRFIYPENRESVLEDLKEAFGR